ncbi:jg4594 [Pararge aegeria aegeria]|uniref:Jg4594 protein n=1 Tax=Pararge aegeria aegeria TaxID=348720 RepID=A0A8S4S7E7_9NEOP|nr:jg4594 [Pararge aegeria aegeria]
MGDVKVLPHPWAPLARQPADAERKAARPAGSNAPATRPRERAVPQGTAVYPATPTAAYVHSQGLTTTSTTECLRYVKSSQ